MTRIACLLLSSVLLLAGCTTNARTLAPEPFVETFHTASTSGTSTPIAHVIILMQENRSFDSLFATFPGADGATSGRTTTGRVDLVSLPLEQPHDYCHSYACFVQNYDNKRLDNWWNATPTFTSYQYADPKDVKPYWTIAENYALADRMFPTDKTASFSSHIDIVAGDAKVSNWRYWVDIPSASPWGCDAPHGTVTDVINRKGDDLAGQGPYPCLARRSMRDLLDAKHVTWKYYVEASGTGNIWNGFRSIPSVFNSPEWTANISSPETNVFTDVKNGTLPSVSWVIPNAAESDHPGISTVDTGPQWVAAVVNAVGQSKYWKDTAIVVTWDDWGGFYDHVPPPQLDYAGLGFRVPMLVVSAYTPKGLISHTQYEFGSILKFVEENWGLGSLHSTDVRANSIADCFDFTRRYLRKFRKITAGPYQPRGTVRVTLPKDD